MKIYPMKFGRIELLLGNCIDRRVSFKIKTFFGLFAYSTGISAWPIVTIHVFRCRRGFQLVAPVHRCVVLVVAEVGAVQIDVRASTVRSLFLVFLFFLVFWLFLGGSFWAPNGLKLAFLSPESDLSSPRDA